jgi:hypothetical protein
MKIIIHRYKTSTIILAVFALMVITITFLSELLQTTQTNNFILKKYQNLFETNDLKNIVQININNKFGEYELQQDQQSWKIINPKILPAKESLTQRLIKQVQQIKIKRIYAKDPINLTNFSLESPTASIKFQNNLQEKTTIDFGLINPFDNSTYITLSNRDAIFQIETPKTSIESLSMQQFIDSRIFTFSKNSFKSISIRKKRYSKFKQQLEINYKNKQFMTYKNKSLSTSKTNNFLTKLQLIKSEIILDKVPDQLSSELNKYLNNPTKLISLEETNGNITTYKISRPITINIPELRIKRNQKILIQSSNRNFPFVVSKDVLSLLSTSIRSLK